MVDISNATACGKGAADELAGYVAQAVDQFTGRVILADYAAVCATGERDYLDAENVEGIYRRVARMLAEHRLQPPRPAEIVEACRRLNVKVVL